MTARGRLRRAWAVAPPGTAAVDGVPSGPPSGGWPTLPRRVPIGELAPHDGPVTGVAFAPAGRLAATVQQTGALRLWDVTAPGRPVQAGGTADVGCRRGRVVRFSPDGRLLAVAGDGAAVWDVRDPARPWPAGGLEPPTRGRRAFDGQVIEFRPDGRLLVGRRAGTISVWEPGEGPGGRWLGRYPWRGRGAPRGPRSLMAVPGRSLLVADGRDVLLVADARDSRGAVQLARCRPRPGGLYGDLSRVLALAVHPGGQFVVSAHHLVDAGDGPAVVDEVTVGWDLRDPRRPRRTFVLAGPWSPPEPPRRRSGPPPLYVRGHDARVVAAAFRPDGAVLATAGGPVLLWGTEDPERPTTLGRLDHSGPVTGLAFSPDGRVLAAAAGTSVTLWDTSREWP